MNRPLRLDRANGKIFGVCSGIHNRYGIDALMLRIGFVAATLLGFGLPLILYIVLALIVD